MQTCQVRIIKTRGEACLLCIEGRGAGWGSNLHHGAKSALREGLQVRRSRSPAGLASLRLKHLKLQNSFQMDLLTEKCC